jgi:hypothetical protein
VRKFAKFIGELPFVGKMTIRPFVYSFYQSKTETERQRSYLHLMILLVFFVLFHAVLGWMGLQMFGFVAPIWVRVAGGLYALANICVVLTQIYLGFRVTKFLFDGLYPRTNRVRPEWNSAEALTMVSVTIGGQIVFFLLYSLYK